MTKSTASSREHNIFKKMIINFNETPFMYPSLKGSKMILIHNVNSQASITGPIVVSPSGKEFPFQLIDAGKAKRNLPMNNQFSKFATTVIPNNFF